MHRSTAAAALWILLVVTATPALAQEPRFAVAVKGGLSAENSEDNLRGTTPALGMTGTLGFAHGWSAEVEFWLPGYIDDARGEPKHRDVLLSFSAVKRFEAGRLRPFVAAGMSFSSTQDWFTFCTANRQNANGVTGPMQVSCDDPDVFERRRERNDGRDGYLLGGAGIEMPLSRRLGFVADVRLSLAPVSVIVRPGVGLVVKF